VRYSLNILIVTVLSGLGKKKSKVCCQYKKPRAGLDDSSDESEDECGDGPGHAGQ
jgi:hypothetical protein